jgi:CHAT domain-containing protein/tetratricopeptide (TPR) repeat protein
MIPCSRRGLIISMGVIALLMFTVPFVCEFSSGQRRSLLERHIETVRPSQSRLCGLEYVRYNKLKEASEPDLRRVLQELRGQSPDLNLYRQRAILSLVAGKPLDAIEFLGREADQDERILSDLAAAHIQRFEDEERNAYFLLTAISLCRRALGQNPDLLEARFNIALALELAGLRESAKIAWGQYLDRDPKSEWSKEAQTHLLQLLKPARHSLWIEDRPVLIKAALAGHSLEVYEIVARFPDLARLYAEEELVELWAESIKRHDKVTGLRALAVLRAIGEGLANFSGDQFVLDLAADIESSRDSRRVQILARAIILYQQALNVFGRDEFEAAEILFRRSYRELSALGSPFASWALLHQAICNYYLSDYRSAIEQLLSVESRVRGESYLSLLGRAQWIKGLVHFSQSDIILALDSQSAAGIWYRKSKEWVNLGYVSSLIASNLSVMGNSSEAWKYRQSALEVLGDIEDPRKVYSILQEAASAASEENRPDIALSLFSELLYRLEGNAPAGVSIETRSRLAVVQGKIGLLNDAQSSLSIARSLLPKVTDKKFSQRIMADMEFAEAVMESQSRPDRALKIFDSVLAFYRRSGYERDVADLLAWRGRVRLRLGNSGAAQLDFISSLQQYIRGFRSTSDVEISQYVSRLRGLLDEDLESRLARFSAHPWEIFPYADWARGLELQLGDSPVGFGIFSRVEDIQQRLPRHTVLIEYAVLPGRLLIWGIGEKLLFVEVPFPADILEGRIKEGVHRLMSQGDLSAGETLYKILVAPVQTLLDDNVKLVVIVPDKFLMGVPFSALIEPRRGRFLLEQAAIVVAVSASSFVQRPEALSQHAAPAILAVGIGEVPSQVSALLPGLPGARKEALEVAALYANSLVLLDSQATPDKLLEVVEQYDIMHFSGHALSESNPQMSALIMYEASDSSGILRAKRLSGGKYFRAKIIVLGACRTALGSAKLGNGMNIANAFIRGGAVTVVASLWYVHDTANSELLKEFHRLLLEGSLVSEALRRAQLACMRFSDGRYRPPKDWATFEVIGGDGRLVH